MSTVCTELKSGNMSAQVRQVVKTLTDIGNRVSGGFRGQLVVGRHVDSGDDLFPSFSFYFLAEKVKGKFLWFIPCMRKRVLVSMNDPHQNYGGEVGCTVLDEGLKNIAEEEIRHHAQAVNATKVTILDDNEPLVI